MQERQFLHVIKTNLKIEQIPIHKIKYHEKIRSYLKKRTGIY